MAFADLVATADRTAQTLLGGESVIYTPLLGDATTVSGIFSAPYVLAQGDMQAGVGTVGPTVFLRLEDLPTDPEVDDPTLTIRGVTYRVAERAADDFGGITLRLRTDG